MRTFWIMQAGIGVAALGASAALGVACSGTVVGGPGTATATDTMGGTETYTDTSTSDCAGGPCDPGTDTATAGPCAYCACGYGTNHSPPGCVDICDSAVSGGSTPNFCDGAPALPMCKACLAQNCGVSDPTQCN